MGGAGLALLSPQSATPTAVADGRFGQQQYYQQQFDSNYEDFMRSMSQVLAQGPPIDTAHQQSLHLLKSICAADNKPSSSSSSSKPAALDEDRLWMLYTKSETLLPNGSRARNLLWRMRGQRRLKEKSAAGRTQAKTVLSGPLTESPKTAAAGGAGSKITDEIPDDITMLDLRSRSLSSHTVVGERLDTAALPLQQQQQQHFMPLPPRDASLDVDMELARPLELWGMPLDPSLAWLPPLPPLPPTAEAGSQPWLPAPPQMQQMPMQQHPFNMAQTAVTAPAPIGFVHDTRLIDARSSAISQNKLASDAAADAAAAARLTEQQLRAVLDGALLSPTSMLPHWPERPKGAGTLAEQPISADSANRSRTASTGGELL
ncbi:hypothetical protein LPJ53_004380 [Coemansia erecta]|uniref:Nitrogen regulatory protein areA GATA-like domain-containing protein n=1 Tax=Coemansia erecta TaxID=147472 RepID=A0A9W7XZX2_9FUNG|nr:hypothetical protein LPJ53_004380 [Coemansia erecta]